MSELRLRLRLRWWGLRPYGARSRVLTALGFIWVLMGSYLTIFEWSGATQQAFTQLLELAPPRVWGSIFLITGFMGILSSRWPPANESWGFVAMGGSAMLWSCFAAIGAVVSDFRAGVASCLMWLAISALVWAVSRLAEPRAMVPAGEKLDIKDDT